jgi:AraC family transcriptional regulator, arabinose operon regulatory protein
MNARTINIWNPSAPGKAFPQLCALGTDTTTSAGYYWRGSQRTAEAGIQVFQYTLKGCGAFRIRETVRLVPEGTGFLCNLFDPDITYFYPQHETNPWSFLYIIFRGAEHWVRELNTAFGYIYRLAGKDPFILQIQDIFAGSEPTVSLSSSTQMQLISTLFVELFRIGEKEGSRTQRGNLIDKAIAAMHERVETPTSTSDIAKQLGISTEHLCRIFRAEMHVSPLVYFQRQKIQHACALLMNQDLTIKKIAARLTIDNVSNFTRFFKQYVGMTPAQFRHQGGVTVSETGAVFRQRK